MRALHPLAWWAWALGLAVAASRAPGPLTVAAVLVAVVGVVLRTRGDDPWARAFPAYLVLGAGIVAIRIGFYVVIGIKTPGPVILDLPRVGLPSWAAGIELLGPVTSTGVLMAASAGLRLATLVVCFGAANALANPKRALRSLPASMHHLGTAVVIGVSVTPALVTSAANVHRAQRLRGGAPTGLRGLATTLVPVLTDALDRSLALASSMDSRGYARTLPGGSDRRVSALLLTALLGAGLGTYGLLGGTTPGVAVALLLVGVGSAVAGSLLAGRAVARTRYRPDPWRAVETRVAASGVAAAALIALAPGPGLVGIIAALVVALVAAAPAVLVGEA